MFLLTLFVILPIIFVVFCLLMMVAIPFRALFWPALILGTIVWAFRRRNSNAYQYSAYRKSATARKMYQAHHQQNNHGPRKEARDVTVQDKDSWSDF